MSRSTPEWCGKNDDTPVPPRVRLRVAERDHFKCKKCTRQVGTKLNADHVKALINGGENRESNLQLLCDWCHTEKTADDVAEKSKTYQRKAKHYGLKKSSRPISGWKSFRGEPIRNPKLSRPRAQGGGR